MSSFTVLPLKKAFKNLQGSMITPGIYAAALPPALPPVCGCGSYCTRCSCTDVFALDVLILFRISDFLLWLFSIMFNFISKIRSW